MSLYLFSMHHAVACQQVNNRLEEQELLRGIFKKLWGSRHKKIDFHECFITPHFYGSVSVARRFYLTSLFLTIIACINRDVERDEICSSSIIIKIIAMGTSSPRHTSGRHNIIFLINLVRKISSRIYCHFDGVFYDSSGNIYHVIILVKILTFIDVRQFRLLHLSRVHLLSDFIIIYVLTDLYN